jgi:uncharacterized membrane protein YhaH (DUF805 family)
MLHFFFGFHGRIRRTHYFLGALITGIIADSYWLPAIMNGHDWNAGWNGDWTWRHGFGWHSWGWPMFPGFWAIGSLIALACLWARFALAAKRWHDAGASGWFSLLSLVPGVHLIVFLLLCLLPPTQGPNQYGPDPRTAGGPAMA